MAAAIFINIPAPNVLSKGPLNHIFFAMLVHFFKMFSYDDKGTMVMIWSQYEAAKETVDHTIT